jgi:hypothetical protein
MEPDMTLISELYEEIERHPPAIEARKLLVEQYITANWMDAVRDAIQELNTICSHDEQVNHWYIAFCQPKSQPPPPYGAATASASGSKSASAKTTPRRTLNPRVATAPLPTDPTELAAEKQNLLQSYKAFRIKARTLLRDARLLQNLRSWKVPQPKQGDWVSDLEALADGRITTVLGGQPLPADTCGTNAVPPPESARAVARKMEANLEKAFDIAVSDLESMIQWLRSTQHASNLDDDGIRELVAKRVRMMVTALPPNLVVHAQIAMLHVEHEMKWRKYVNDETMLGDAVEDIPRDHFYATEDGYAWDMDELAQAITSNKGVMRNPLSKHMFTTNDIKAILQHPLGQPLAALQIEQSKLKKGVRPKTMEEMDRMANVLLEDMADDALKSREAVDEFLAYVATLPEAEQKAIDNLRVPSRDSHTGQAFDGTIGDAVRDAKANKMCFHKTG